MKFTKSLMISLMLIIGLAVVGCKTGGGGASSGGSSPSDVFKQFYAAIEKGNFKAAADLTTEPAVTQQLLALMGEELKKEFAKDSIAKVEETITGNTANVKYTLKSGTKEDVDLVKKDGKWKIKMQ